jgi:hypothetical protein
MTATIDRPRTAMGFQMIPFDAEPGALNPREMQRYFPKVTRPDPPLYGIRASTTTETERRCATCRAWFPLTAFHRAAAKPRGRGYYCRNCMAARNRLARQRRKEDRS